MKRDQNNQPSRMKGEVRSVEATTFFATLLNNRPRPRAGSVMGQTTAEYAILIGVVIAALVGMQVYVKRGTQVKLKVGVDEFANAGTTDLTWLTGNNIPEITGNVTSGSVQLRSTTAQYEPYYAESKYQVVRDSTETEDTDLGAGTITKTIAPGGEQTTRKATGYTKQRQWQGERD